MCRVCDRPYGADLEQIHWISIDPVAPRCTNVRMCLTDYTKYSAYVRCHGYPRGRALANILRRIKCYAIPSTINLGGLWCSGISPIPIRAICSGGCIAKVSSGYLDAVPRDIRDIITGYVVAAKMRWLPAGATLPARCRYLCRDCWAGELLG